MLYPENQTWVPQVKSWISASFARADTQNQRRYFNVSEVLSPFFSDPWNFNVTNQCIALPDGYVMVEYPPESVYTPLLDRFGMAVEATDEMMNFLEMTTYVSDQDTDYIRRQFNLFFNLLYAWNTTLKWIDKVHPEDIVARILFKSPVVTYAQRAALVNGLNPDNFLRGSSYYVVNVWLNSLTTYASAGDSQFFLDGNAFSLRYPGGGYAYGKDKTAFDMQSTARGLAFSMLGYLAANIGADKSQLVSQYWDHRLAILTDAATYRNEVMSYLLRTNF